MTDSRFDLSAGIQSLEASSSFGSTQSNQRKGRTRRRLESTMGKSARPHSADSRPQYDTYTDRSSTSSMLYLPQESRAVVTPSPLYTTPFASDFDMHELGGMSFDSRMMGTPSRAQDGHSLYLNIPQSLSPDSGGRISRGRGRSSTYFEDPEIKIPYNWTTHEPSRQDPTDKDYLKDSLIMFGDAYADQASVYTGLSQQELLQKKRRDQTVKKRKEKKYGKKKKDRIVNLPTGLLSTTTFPTTYTPTSLSSVNSEHQSGASQLQSRGRTGLRSSLIRKRQKDQPEKEKTRSTSRVWSIIPSLSRSGSPPPSSQRSRISPCSSEDLVSTATSSHESERNADSNSFDRPPRESPVVTQGEIPTTWMQKRLNTPLFNAEAASRIRTSHIPKEKDFVPTFASTAAMYIRKIDASEIGYLETTKDTNLAEYHNNTVHGIRVHRIEGVDSVYSESSTPLSGRVRFADNLNTSRQGTSTTNGNMKISPTSVTELEGGIPADWTGQLSYLPEPRQINIYNDELPPVQSSTPRNPRLLTEKPKSILRRGRTNRSDASSMDWHCDETASSRSNKSVRISSTPTKEGEFLSEYSSASGFVDENGDLISPITVVNSESAIESDAQSGREGSNVAGVAGWQSVEKDRSIKQLCQQPCLDETGRRDDDSGMISEAYSEFITSVASVVVQTAARRFLAKSRVRKMREGRTQQRRQHNALGHTTKKHGEPMGATSRQEEDMKYRLFDLAAVRIQSVFRGWMARDFAAVDQFAATIIQKCFRGFLCRSNYSYDMFRIVIVQSMARRYLALEATAHRLAYVTLIQSQIRGFLVRKALARNCKSYDALTGDYIAATKIQSQWRSYSCEMAYLRTYEDIVIVQTLARGWITRTLLSAWMKAHNIRPRRIRLRSGASRRTLSSGFGGSAADTQNGYGDNVRAVSDLGIAHGQVREIEKFGARQGKSRFQMRYREVVIGGDIDDESGKRSVHAELGGNKNSIPPSEESEIGRSDFEIVRSAVRLEQDKRNTELATLAVRRKDGRHRKELEGAIDIRGEELRRRELVALASQKEAERIKEQRMRDLAIIASRHELQKSPAEDPSWQNEVPGKLSVSVETGRTGQSGLIGSSNPLPPDQTIDQLRKERIAYHCDPDAAALLNQERILSSSIRASHIEPASAPEVRENVPSIEDSNNQLAASAKEVLTDSSAVKATHGSVTPPRFAPIRPPKRVNPFESERTDAEQRRIDKIHEIFRRVGLMNRSSNAASDSNTAVEFFDEEKSEKADVFEKRTIRR